MNPVTKADWKTEPMPDEGKRLLLSRLYSGAEFDQIKIGVLPQQMEDKWFIYFEEPWLFVHRSWTGHCIFRVRFEPLEDGVQLVEAFVNSQPDQYRSMGDDASLLGILLDSRAGKDIRGQMIDYIRAQVPLP